MALFTVLGARGFIGGHVAEQLRAAGHEVLTPAKGAESDARGHVVYCIGIVGGDAARAHEMAEAHAGLPARLLDGGTFDSFLYLSSTRVYDGAPGDGREDMALPAPANIFTETKAAGEEAVLSRGGRVARIANVYGAGMNPNVFLAAVIRDLKAQGEVTIGEGPQSSKDYIAVEDAAEILARIALEGREKVYNVASGTETTHEAVAGALSALGAVRFREGGPVRTFPHMDIARIEKEFGVRQRDFLTQGLPALL